MLTNARYWNPRVRELKREPHHGRHYRLTCTEVWSGNTVSLCEHRHNRRSEAMECEDAAAEWERLSA